MMNPRWISRRLSEKHSLAAARCIIGGMAAAILGLTAGTAVAQIPIFVSHQTAPNGYTLHESIDLGGRVANIDGSGAMYDTLVNEQSGPRIMGETYELRALPNTKNTLVDHLKSLYQRARRRSEQRCQAGFFQGQALRILRLVPP
jgi:hypothetical protein